MNYALRKRILVTGGAGYIGSHACKALAQAGYTPVSYDNLVYGHPWAVRWGPVEQGDINDRVRLDAVLAQYQPAAGTRPAITIHGDDYATPDGTCIRDYIHVTDLAQAHVLALQALEQGAASTVYNLGNGQGFSVRQVIDRAEAVTGKSIPIKIGPRRPGDPPRLVGDASRIRRDLGWQPQYAELDTILTTAWRWHCAKP